MKIRLIDPQHKRPSNFALPDMDLDGALPWLEDPEPVTTEPTSEPESLPCAA